MCVCVCVCFTVFDTGRSSPILILELLKTASRNLLRLTGESNLPCSDVVTELQLTSRHIYENLSVSRQCFIYMYERLICLFILWEKSYLGVKRGQFSSCKPCRELQTVQRLQQETLRWFARPLLALWAIYIYSSNAMK